MQKIQKHTGADPGVPSSDPKGEVSASTGNSPSAPAESPVEGRTVRETGRVNDRVNTHNTNAAHAPRDQRLSDPPETTPSWGPKQVRRGASPAPRPWQGPAAGPMSPVLGRPLGAPRSRPVNQAARAPGSRRHHGVRREHRHTVSHPTGRGTVHQRGATRHAREARCRSQPRHETSCQATQPPQGTHTTPKTCRACEHAGRTKEPQQKHKSGIRRSTPQNKTPHEHTGELAPSGQGHGTRFTTHPACAPVNRSQVAKDAEHTAQHTESAHR